jgi:hypothetical protein
MEISENKLKEILTEQRTEFQHVVGIFKEDLESKINLITEQYQDIKSTQKIQTEMVGSLMEDVQIIKSDVQFLKVELKRKVDYDEFDALTNGLPCSNQKSENKQSPRARSDNMRTTPPAAINTFQPLMKL